MEDDLSCARRAARTLSLAAALCLGGACFTPNVEGLTGKVREECRLAPIGPYCALNDPAASDYMYERWFLEEVDSEAEQECLLALDCSSIDQSSVPVEEISRCMRQDDLSFERYLEPSTREDCRAECVNALTGCGETDPCGVDEVERCYAERDACLEACRT